MTVFEGICFGFFGGVVTTLISLLSGVFHGVDKGKSDTDRGLDSNCNVTCRNCRCVDMDCEGDDGK